MNNYLLAYSIYTPTILGLTIWVARTMHKNTKVFLNDIFGGQDTVANSVNNLLQVGFYLVALGFGFLKLRIYQPETRPSFNPNLANVYHLPLPALPEFSQREMVETLAVKLGGFTLFIGFMLFLNLFLMLILRKGHKQANKEQPFRPSI